MSIQMPSKGTRYAIGRDHLAAAVLYGEKPGMGCGDDG